jgi:hypothetical protein
MWQWRRSPVTCVAFRGLRVHVKRDDVFHLAGNKVCAKWSVARCVEDPGN